MRDYIELGATPCGEFCADIGDPDYPQKSRAECQRFIALLRKTFGHEPPGAHLETRTFEHDYGTYREVVCYYDEGNEPALEYAMQCESHAPENWHGVASRN